MPKITVKHVQVTKLYPLAISRGVSTGSRNLFVFAEEDGLVGVGECAPGTGYDETLAAIAESQIMELVSNGLPHSIEKTWRKAREMNMDASALAALDIALWDLLAKKANMPLYKMLGLCKPHVPTSVTIGINPVDVILERVPDILYKSQAKCLKIKLGSPDGIERDKENYEAARKAAKPFNVKLRVDANGGWSVEDAKHMIQWLADREADYVEQPLAEGQEKELPKLFDGRPIPIFVDESCRWSKDVPTVAGAVDGVNMKLMKCGGLTEALRIVATARAHGLKTMIGCMGESSVAIAAGAAMGGLLDHIDLDSHFNLNPDPAAGLEMIDGVVTPRDVPGHGAYLKNA
ncbi:MAG TPA: dipeptide epimerase [Fimbriimonadaceae bacterium]